METVNITKNSFTCSKWNYTDEASNFLKQHKLWMKSLAYVIVGVLGLFVNVIGIIVLSNRKMKRIFFNQLLICLAVFDIIFLICCLNDSFRKHVEESLCPNGPKLEEHQKYILLVLYPVRQMAMFVLILL